MKTAFMKIKFGECLIWLSSESFVFPKITQKIILLVLLYNYETWSGHCICEEAAEKSICT
jgi:hypothetical protein